LPFANLIIIHITLQSVSSSSNKLTIVQLNLLLQFLTIVLLRSIEFIKITSLRSISLRCKVSVCVSEGVVWSLLRSSKGSVEISKVTSLGWVKISLWSTRTEGIVLGSIEISEIISWSIVGSIVRSIEGRVVEISWSIVRSIEGRVVESSWSIIGSIEGRVVEISWSIVGSIEGRVVEISWPIVGSIEGRVVEISWSIIGSIEGRVVEISWSITEGTRVVEISWSIVGSVGSVEGIRVVEVEVSLRNIRIEGIVLTSVLVEVSETVLVEVSSLWFLIALRTKALPASEHRISLSISLWLSVG